MTLSRYYTAINLIVLSLVIYGGVDIFYTLAGSKMVEVKTESQVASRTEKNPSSGKRRSFNYYAPAIDKDLFGAAEKMGLKDDQIEIQDLEPTSMKVTLIGTVSGDDQIATAIIEEKAKRKQALYKEGDSLQNATIVKILRGKVVLRVQDKNQILTMEETSTKGSSSKTRRPLRRTPTSSKTASTSISLQKEVISKALENLPQILSQARIRPHYKDGKADGLLLSQVKPNTIFTKLGLRNGDIIQAFDGEDLQNTDDVMDFYDELRSGSPVSLDIMRRGRKKTITYEFK